MTQEQLSEISGVSRDAIALIEAGTRVPTLPTLEKLAQAFSIPPSRFFCGEPERNPTDGPASRVAALMSNASPHEQETVERIVDILLEGSVDRPGPRRSAKRAAPRAKKSGARRRRKKA